MNRKGPQPFSKKSKKAVNQQRVHQKRQENSNKSKQQDDANEQIEMGMLQASSGKRMGLGFDDNAVNAKKGTGIQKKIIKKKDLVQQKEKKEQQDEEKQPKKVKKQNQSSMGKVVGFVDNDSESDEETSRAKSFMSKKDKKKN